MLICKGVHAVFRLHQKQIVDFTPGRAHARPGQKRAPKGMPPSRWVSACGLMDQVVEYFLTVADFGGIAVFAGFHKAPRFRCRSRNSLWPSKLSPPIFRQPTSVQQSLLPFPRP